MKKTKAIDALWAHIHWLGVLATTHSFTAAAQRLNVSKAAMSQRIGELEQAAGVPLVRRTTRSVRLTEAGQQLVDATRGSFEAIDRSFAGVKDLASSPRGLLRVTAPVALGRQEIAPRIAAFLRQYPEIRVELELSDRLVSLAQEGFDLAVRHVAQAPDTHVAWTLCDTASLLVAAPSYLRSHGVPQHPSELQDHHCLHYLRKAEMPSWSFEPVRRRADRISIAVKGPFAADNSEVLREVALAGIGVAILPDFSAHREVAAGKLKLLLPDWRAVGAFGNRLYAIRPYSPQVPRPVQALVRHLRESLGGGFPVPTAVAVSRRPAR